MAHHPARAELTAEIQLVPNRCNLLEIPIKLPAGSGYQVEALELSPPELMRGWQRSGDFVVVELKRPLTPGKKVAVNLQMRAGFRDIIASSRDLTFPTLQMIDGVKREGTLTVTLDPSLQGEMLEASAPLASATGPVDGTPTWRLTFRGQGFKARMRVTPAPVHVRLRGKHAATLSDPEAALQFHWEAEPLTGVPEFLDFRMGPGFPAAWNLKAEEGGLRVHHWERLGSTELGPAKALTGALLEPALPGGTRWRFHLAEPLRKKGSLTLEAAVPGGRIEQARRRFEIPLMVPVPSDSFGQEMHVDSILEPIDQITGGGSLLVRSSAATGKTSLQLQLDQKAGLERNRPATLMVWTRPQKRAASPIERCDEASITTCVRRDGTVWQRIGFRLWHWRDRTLELPFPAGSDIVAVRLNDRWLERPELQVAHDGVRLTLPFDQNVSHVSL